MNERMPTESAPQGKGDIGPAVGVVIIIVVIIAGGLYFFWKGRVETPTPVEEAVNELIRDSENETAATEENADTELNAEIGGIENDLDGLEQELDGGQF